MNKRLQMWIRGGRGQLWLWAFVLLPALAAVAACSATLEWDPDGLACDNQVVDGRTDFCLKGYSCLKTGDANAPGRCVRDNSLKSGASCSNTVQCLTGEVCPLDLLAGGGVAGSDGIKRCYPRCNTQGADPYYTAAACKTGSVCLPFLDSRAIDPNKSLIGACLPTTACTAGEACSSPSVSAGTCVQLDTGANACVTGCEITWSAALTYSDNCDSLHSCQPVGAINAQEFACTYNGQNSTTNPLGAIGGQSIAATGAACSLMEQPCAKGEVCAPTGICAPYCLITANQTFPCPTGMSCCPFKTFATSQASGFCSASCP